MSMTSFERRYPELNAQNRAAQEKQEAKAQERKSGNPTVSSVREDIASRVIRQARDHIQR